MSDAHDRWIRRLRRTWPEGVPARQPEPEETPVSGPAEPWPETFRDPGGMAMQKQSRVHQQDESQVSA